MRAIVTGGAGFIGSHVADALLARGDEVHILDDLSTGSRAKAPTEAALHVADIRSHAREVFDLARPDVCFHLAAQADVGTSVERPDFDAEVNVVGTVRVLEAARAHGAQVIFSSTGGALYGECERPADEQVRPAPFAPYGSSKLAGEEYLACWNRLHGTHHVSLRLANVYGPRQEASLEGGVVAIFLERLRAGQPAQIFGDGEQTRDFVYVGDVAEAMLAAVGRSGGPFNVATGVTTSVRELYGLCARACGSGLEPELAPARLGDIRQSSLDPARAAAELGWRARHSLESGLQQTAQQ